MQIIFYKYQGTGNDFVILDNRKNEYDSLTTEQIHFLCDRRFGIGADGLMLLNTHPDYDFEMKYFNADGKESTMCGNGGRCLVKFAYDLGILKSEYRFIAVDGEHEAEVEFDGTVSLKMNDVDEVQYKGDHFILNTGSPHYVQNKENVMQLDVYTEGYKIRYSPTFEKEGINVNFVEQLEDSDKIFVRTYERGVENETYSCGTGVTAAALISYHNEAGFNHVEVQTKGGQLSVEYDKIGESFKNIWLTGPAEKVFEGTIILKAA
jgi:diaminopimelate epimerase